MGLRYLFFLLVTGSISYGQTIKKVDNSAVARPKLVVGLVVDQMRWDFLYRYYTRYQPNGAFRRMIDKGFSCENTLINYTPTYTACGHTCIYTGAVPAIHGITGNDWWDNKLNKPVYCTDDDSVSGVGTTAPEGKMSPRNMQVTTICDELKLATNLKSKTIGIAFKDRGGILPAGHSANAAYWYESASGNWISSSYYMKTLPQWVTDFNAGKPVDKFYRQGWNTLHPVATYTQSTVDEKPYEGKPFGPEMKGFPYKFDKFIGSDYRAIATTPFGSTLTKDMAVAAINNEQLGMDNITDFLAVSFSAPDYIGHTFGPNSIEVEDTYLRLDKDLGDFFNFLDRKIGKDQYLVFLSADHGVAHAPGFMRENRLPGGTIDFDFVKKEMDSLMQKKFGNSRLVLSMHNYQITLNRRLIDTLQADEPAIKKWIIDYLGKKEWVANVFETQNIMNLPMNDQVRKKLANGFFPARSGDLQIMLKSGWMSSGYSTGTTHGSWNPYDSHIPLVWYGWNIKHGRTNREIYMTDIAPTLAALLRIQMPSGSVGTVIDELIMDK